MSWDLSPTGAAGHIYAVRLGIGRFLDTGKPVPRGRVVPSRLVGYGEAWGTLPHGRTKTIASGDSAPMEAEGADLGGPVRRDPGRRGMVRSSSGTAGIWKCNMRQHVGTDYGFSRFSPAEARRAMNLVPVTRTLESNQVGAVKSNDTSR